MSEVPPALVHRAIRGDRAALDTLAAAYRPVVHRTAMHVLADPDRADDVAQEVFIRLQAALPGFRGDAAIGTWIYRVTVNLCLDEVRRRRRHGTHVPLEVAPPPVLRVAATQPDTVEAERTRVAVRDAIERLPRDQRQAVKLRYFSGLSYAEIARVTGTPPGTVASRVFRALKRLGDDATMTRLEGLT